MWPKRSRSPHGEPGLIPHGPWVMAQGWYDLLFAHWPVPVAALRPFVPDALEIDTYDGQAWIGVVPFRMAGVRPRAVPPLPWLSAFPELNVRTYVRPRNAREDKPGVWFFSLDATNPVAVEGARRVFHLPYFRARMAVRREGATIHYRSRRTHRGAPPADLAGTYAPAGAVLYAELGSLADWLTARYCLYAMGRRRLYRCDIYHAPWPLQPATADLTVNTMTGPLGLTLPQIEPLLHFSRQLEVVVWPLRRVEMLQ